MAYSGEDLFRNYRKTYVIAPFQASQVSPLGYDLQVGFALTIKYDNAEDKGTRGKAMETVEQEDEPTRALRKRSEGRLIIGPNEAVLIVTLEQIYLGSKVLGTVHAKASLSMQGLLLNPVTVDPNFAAAPEAAGRLVLFMHNVSGRNIVLKEKQSIATLIMHEVSTETFHYPEKSAFEHIVTALKETYDQTVTDEIEYYIKSHLGGRGGSEFERDRKTSQNYKGGVFQDGQERS